jgi:hypothetical protein
MSNIKVFENLVIVLRSIPSTFNVLINRSHKCDKLSRKNPVKISILDFFIVFILLRVKVPEVIPAMFDCYLKTLETMKDLKTNIKD